MTIAASLLALVAVLLALVAASPSGPRPATRAAPARPAQRLTGRRRERALDHAFPDALELVVISVEAGLLPADALRHLTDAVHPTIGAAFADVRRRTEQGQRFADALSALVERLGTRSLGLAATLAASDRTGMPLGPVVDRLADEARQHRRRLVEATLRELPIRLTLPLTLCTLPSFLLIAIAPLVVGALSSLSK
ncbi:MAG: type II secretion system F family protein [Ilumatobacteraceae bacterium]